MIYEHQINWANEYDTNLDISISRLVWNALIVLLSTLTLHPPEWMANSEMCTLTTVKIELIHTISYKLNEYIPSSISSIPSLLLLILLV